MTTTVPDRPLTPWTVRTKAVALALLFPLAGAWLAMLGGLLWWSNAPMMFGWKPRVVLTGSMTPALEPGDVVLVHEVKDPDTLPRNRLIVVSDPGRRSGSYVHRIVRRDDAGDIVTKGDANQSEDYPAVTGDRVQGEVRLVVPAIGLPLIWRHENLAALAGTTVVTWAALAHVLHVVRRRQRSTEPVDHAEAY